MKVNIKTYDRSADYTPILKNNMVIITIGSYLLSIL